MQLLDWIVCDDIRFEQGGKKILIGMFDNEIKFNVSPDHPRPIVYRLASLIRVAGGAGEAFPDEAKISFYSDDVVVRDIPLLKINTPEKETPKLLTMVVKTDFKFSISSELSLKIDFYKDKEVVETLESPITVSILFPPEKGQPLTLIKTKNR